MTEHATDEEYLAVARTVGGALARDAEASGVEAELVIKPPVHDWPMTRFFEVHIDGAPDSGLEITYDARAEFQEDLAEFFQEVMQEHVSGPWPPCPAHGEPMSPTTADDVLVWICERDATIAVPIGGLERRESSPPVSETDEARLEAYWQRRERE